MKIALMSGAAKNAGDFLIVDRTSKLLKHLCRDVKINKYNRWQDQSKNIESINESDLIVFAGGPFYDGLLQNSIRSVDSIDKMIPKVMILGGGTGTSVSGRENVLLGIGKKPKELLDRIKKHGEKMSCRDYNTIINLLRAGYSNTIMTGCPAWFDINYIGISDNMSLHLMNPQKICVSDPGRVDNQQQSFAIVEYLQQLYPQSKIQYVFHRGWTKDDFTPKSVAFAQNALKDQLQRIGIECIDISYGSDGFSIYDSCDIHIGYRLHAHIYCLSHKRATIHIEEDERGAGLNSMLGLSQITSYNKLIKNISNHTLANIFYHVSKNRNILRDLNNNITLLNENDWQPLKTAFKIIDHYFPIMCNYINGYVHSKVDI
jgi:hypothetical protein